MLTHDSASTSKFSEISNAIRPCRGALLTVAGLSGVLNVLYLTGAVFMLEIYDRVLPSRSMPTLFGIALIAALLYGFQGVLDIIRSRILVRIGASLDQALSLRVYDVITRLPLSSSRTASGIDPLRDLDQVRNFVSGMGPPSFFDLPWMPLYLIICYLFHPLIGLAATIGGLILFSITLATETLTRKPVLSAAGVASQRVQLAEASRRNAEVLHSMGMAARVASLWDEINCKYLVSQRRVSDVAGGLSGVSKVLRMALQSAVLGIGAYLVIYQEATAGIIIASSILTSRALAPVEAVVSHWRGFVSARQSWRKLNHLLAAFPAPQVPMDLPKPVSHLFVENVSVVPPNSRAIVVHDASFSLQAGNGLGVVGPSASGKSSLVRAIVGVWKPLRGAVRLDGAELEQWSRERLGDHLGYLPQDVELFAGTVAQNIARFQPRADADAVIAAAQAAGVHELILGLPGGYETQIGESGGALSAGQRQRIALARALYGEPFLVVLDEPNSNLDSAGEEALTAAILGVRKRGGIVIVVAHRPSALAGVDLVLVMGQGRVQTFGPRDQVLSRLRRPAAVPASATASLSSSPGLKVVGESEGAQS